MEKLFLLVIHMSLTASYVIVFIIFVRLLLKKAPKLISYLLWSVAAFRLICPISLESLFSLLPHRAVQSPTTQNIAWLHNSPLIGSTITGSYADKVLLAPVVTNSMNPMQLIIWVGSLLWLVGIGAMLCYSIVSMLLLKRRLKAARHFKDNIYETECFVTPFVLGIVKPVIFIPAGLSEEERSYILRHEQTHIRRFDYIVKPFAFILLSLHWFNPMVWIAFLLMSADMELSCDEKVIREMGCDIRKAYSTSLLALAARKHILNGSPLAFGEGNVKRRIKNVLRYRKPSFWIIIAAVITATVTGAGLVMNPETKTEPPKKDTKPDVINVSNKEGDQQQTDAELKATYGISWLKNGELQYDIKELPDDAAKFAETVIMDYMIKSAAWPGVDIKSLKESYLIRTSYSDGTSTDYYAYIIDGKAVLQIGTDGHYSRISDRLYDQLVELVKGRAAVDNYRDAGNGITPVPDRTELETCISEAIMKQNIGQYPEFDVATEAHTVLKTTEDGNNTSVYAMVLYMEFNYTEKGLEECGGSHMPVEIDFKKNEAGEYELVNYWIPLDGSYHKYYTSAMYATSIKKKFPTDISEAAIDTQKYVLAETQSCYAHAVEYKGVDTEMVLSALIDVICSSPASASDPKAYMNAHPIEYREMLFYGSYTLRYCYSLFERGEQTGLKGHILASLCRDLMGKEGAGITASTGQEWYNKFKAKALRNLDRVGGGYMKENYPGEWILLQMLSEEGK